MITHSSLRAATPGSIFASAICVAAIALLPARAQQPAAPQQPTQPLLRQSSTSSGPPGPAASPSNAQPLQNGVPGQPMQPAAPPQQPEAPGTTVQYHFEQPTPLDRFTDQQIDLLEKLNRVDRSDIGKLQMIVVPDRWDLPTLAYSPLPQFVAQFAPESKAIVIDLPAQVFGAYENGRLIRWGPVNTGKADTPTPPGLYHLNWKARLHTSTENDEWKMPYYFNFANYLGLGMHEYHMPGKPASHGCVRMLDRDAQWIFDWGQQWEYSDGKKVADGTPVLIVGQYRFGDPKPWMDLLWLARGVQLPANLMSSTAS